MQQEATIGAAGRWYGKRTVRENDDRIVRGCLTAHPEVTFEVTKRGQRVEFRDTAEKRTIGRVEAVEEGWKAKLKSRPPAGDPHHGESIYGSRWLEWAPKPTLAEAVTQLLDGYGNETKGMRRRCTELDGWIAKQQVGDGAGARSMRGESGTVIMAAIVLGGALIGSGWCGGG